MRHRLASLPLQPSIAAQRSVRELCIRQCFTQFLRRMLLPYDRDCPNCQQRREASLTLVMPPPKVLLIRYSWSISFPVNEKDLTFCGVPEMVGKKGAR